MNKIMNKKSIMIETVNYLNQLIEISSLMEELCLLEYSKKIQDAIMGYIKGISYGKLLDTFTKIQNLIGFVTDNLSNISYNSSVAQSLLTWKNNMSLETNFYGWALANKDANLSASGYMKFKKIPIEAVSGGSCFYCSSGMYNEFSDTTNSLVDICVNLRNEIIIQLGDVFIDREIIRCCNKILLGENDIDNRIIDMNGYVTQKLASDNDYSTIESQMNVVYILNGKILNDYFALYNLLKRSNRSSTYIASFYNWVDGYVAYTKSTNIGKNPTQVPDSLTMIFIARLRLDYVTTSDTPSHFIIPESTTNKRYSLASVLKDLKNNI